MSQLETDAAENKASPEGPQDELLADSADVLLEAGIKNAQYLIATLPDDAANLFVVLSARQLKKELFIISRASLVNSQKKLFLVSFCFAHYFQ